MPLVTRVVYEPDAFDREMERGGWINEIEAGEQLGMPLAALRSMANCGDIILRVEKGRRYFEAQSVSRHLATHGYPSAEQRRLAYIESLGDRGQCGSLGQERLEILQRIRIGRTLESVRWGAAPA